MSIHVSFIWDPPLGIVFVTHKTHLFSYEMLC